MAIPSIHSVTDEFRYVITDCPSDRLNAFVDLLPGKHGTSTTHLHDVIFYLNYNNATGAMQGNCARAQASGKVARWTSGRKLKFAPHEERHDG